MNMLTELADKGLVPDMLLRAGIRMLDRKRIRHESRGTDRERRMRRSDWIRRMQTGPIAVATDAANAQHYEVPAGFFTQVLGRHLKYSSGYWPAGVATLDDAEAAMLALTCKRAGLADGQQILELGCGWGAVSLWMAAHYPNSRILSVSNSRSQRAFIRARCADRGIDNLTVVTADMNTFSTDMRFDRVVSVEMFEHMRNWQELLRRIHAWLLPRGELFVHIFSHRQYAYPFEIEGSDDWMARHFFTGGMMPSDDLLYAFQERMKIAAHWQLDGTHYQRTAEAWLHNMKVNRQAILPVLASVYGADQAAKWFQRWRIFFMACAELWGFRGGSEWLVSHYRLQRRE